jgi:hypothetical protein
MGCLLRTCPPVCSWRCNWARASGEGERK